MSDQQAGECSVRIMAYQWRRRREGRLEVDMVRVRTTSCRSSNVTQTWYLIHTLNVLPAPASVSKLGAWRIERWAMTDVWFTTPDEHIVRQTSTQRPLLCFCPLFPFCCPPFVTGNSTSHIRHSSQLDPSLLILFVESSASRRFNSSGWRFQTEIHVDDENVGFELATRSILCRCLIRSYYGIPH